MELNRNLDGLRLGGIRRFTNLAKAVDGCILLTLGEPEFDTPGPIRAAAKAALDRGLTHYTANPGDIGLRQAIAGFEAEKRGLTYTPEEVLVTLGATQAIYTAMTGVLNPGDEVIIPTPAFSLYDTVARMAGATPVYVDTAGDGFQLTAQAVERAVTEKTKLLVLNSPNNPTGVVYTRENLGAIANLVRERDMFVLCDDVYWGLGPCFTFTQFTQLKEKILAVQSFSKPYAMTGWRIGYLMAPQPVLERLTVLHSHMVTCAPTMLQAACKAALAWDPGEMAACYAQRRAYICRRLADMGLPAQEPQGAFYVFPSVRHLTQDDGELCLRLIRRAKVAAVPGSVFGAPGYLRMSYCCAMDQLEAAMDRLAEFLQNQ